MHTAWQTILLAITSANLLALLVHNRRLRTALATARHEADHDPLTGLPNRRALLRHLDALLTDRTRPVGVALLDLNDFKAINDQHGHAAGDNLLIHVADTLTALDLPAAYIGRMSGDEFLIITDDVEHTSRENATAAADALGRSTLAIFGEPVNCRASIGLAIADHGTRTVADLLTRADAAMYDAKRHGTAVQVWHPTTAATAATAGTSRRRYR
ncbi:GGDEF domain-containing protein [Micromonospora narathiwatensis]|uniref:Diguanylate cyclase (GGDEF) domain-containing protein n=1 Tax=Micromonospora narathiwatensis TaxID=299146 RepID=A0A1A8ZAB6_9ACTN|nr:GGDEF domain-containing protein [Micromonospora narathiwatensis]SBT40741.1 diguanylate cyclase (GGDEF) domain-containing protein [Micromonospora narathiwatensis]